MQQERQKEWKSHLRLLLAALQDLQSHRKVGRVLKEEQPAQEPQQWEAQAGSDSIRGGLCAMRRAAGMKCTNPSQGWLLSILEGYVGAGCCTLRSVCTSVDPSPALQVRQDLQQSPNGYTQAFSSIICQCLNVCKISSDDTFPYELAGLADTNQELNTIFSKHIKSPPNMLHAETLFVITLKYQKLEKCQLLPSDGNNNDIDRNN